MVSSGTRYPSGFQVQFVGDVLQVIVRLCCARRVKGVGLDDVRAGFEIGAMDLPDHIGLSQAEQIIIASEVVRKVGEAFTPEFIVGKASRLDHGPHGAVKQQDAFG